MITVCVYILFVCRVAVVVIAAQWVRMQTEQCFLHAHVFCCCHTVIRTSEHDCLSTAVSLAVQHMLPIRYCQRLSLGGKAPCLIR